MNIDLALKDIVIGGGPALYGGVFVIGLIYGLTTCTFSCLPLVGTYIVGTRSSFSGGVKAVFLFSIASIISAKLPANHSNLAQLWISSRSLSFAQPKLWFCRSSPMNQKSSYQYCKRRFMLWMERQTRKSSA